MAKELLYLYAQRKAIKGFSFSPEDSWQSEFERTFEYAETEDQLLAIKEIMGDMESESPWIVSSAGMWVMEKQRWR